MEFKIIPTDIATFNDSPAPNFGIERNPAELLRISSVTPCDSLPKQRANCLGIFLCTGFSPSKSAAYNDIPPSSAN